jgi:TPP-dependent pyruvate/acetoin dehydrogenase alpha subunit
MTETQHLEIFKRASLCRVFEETVFDYIQKKLFKFPIYLSAGEEFIAATISLYCEKLKPAIFAQHRAHHTYLSYGGNIDELIDELLGRPTGCAGGMGGSASIQSKSIGMYGHDGLMGTQIPIAVGYSLASKRPTIAIMGDASAEEDYVMSAIAWAGTKKLPILFVVEDNNLSILTEKKVRRSWDYKKFSESVGVQAFNVEDSPSEIWNALNTIENNFPALLNVKTERLFWHAGAGIDPYEKRDRYKIESDIIGFKAQEIYKETKEMVESIWKKHLETQ